VSRPVARKDDHVVAVDTHMVVPATGGAPVAVRLPFDGTLVESLSPNVLAEHRPVALVGSIALQPITHVAPGGTFVKPPSNQARVVVGSATVLVNHRSIARAGDRAETCNDPADLPVGMLVADGTVLSG
jgi:uncharacterized Zn-binding protein involved in type VI secretion